MKHLKIFTSNDCQPCKGLKPLLENLPSGVTKAYFDRDTDSAVFDLHQVMSVPSLILFKDDEPPKRSVGGLTYEQLREFLA